MNSTISLASGKTLNEENEYKYIFEIEAPPSFRCLAGREGLLEDYFPYSDMYSEFHKKLSVITPDYLERVIRQESEFIFITAASQEEANHRMETFATNFQKLAGKCFPDHRCDKLMYRSVPT